MNVPTANLDYILFLHGLSLMLLGALVAIPNARRDGLPWRWLMAFGWVHGLNQWLNLWLLSQEDSPVFQGVRLVTLAVSFLPLVEFGRRGVSPKGVLFGWRGWSLMMGLTGLGALLGGVNGLDAACRYGLGLPGAILAALALWRVARSNPIRPCLGLGLVAVALLLYGLVVGLVVPTAPFFPASWLNQDHFLALTGFPIQLPRMGCALAILAGVWFYQSYGARRELETWRIALLGRGWRPFGFLLLVSLGGMATAWRGGVADTEIRQRLLEQAVKIVRTIQLEDVRALTFTAADQGTPVFERIRQQMIAYQEIYPVRGIYSMSLRQGKLVFGPESYAKDDPMASPPGTIYDAPNTDDLEAIRSGRSITMGPTVDAYGAFISAVVPVFDLHSNEVLMLIGLDISAKEWSTLIAARRLPIIVGTLVLLLIFLGSIATIEWRNRLPEERRLRWRHLETVLFGGCGLLLAGVISVLNAKVEDRERRALFHRLADAQMVGIRDHFQEIHTNLTVLAQFFRSSERVERQEFSTFVMPMLRSGVIQSYQWIPWVPAMDKEAMERAARRAGVVDFTIWQRDAAAQRVSALARADYYPVYFAEPSVGNEAVLGFDLGSEPWLRVLLETATRTGLMTASEPIGLFRQDEQPYQILVLDPLCTVSAAMWERRAEAMACQRQGFVLGVLRVQSLFDKVQRIGGGTENEITIRLLKLVPGHSKLQSLAEYPLGFGEKMTAVSALPISSHDDFRAIYPLFGFGRSYVVLIEASPVFHIAHPRRASWLVGLAGLLLAVELTIFVGVLQNRQIFLQHEVRKRTTELQESEERFHRMFEKHDAVMLLIDPESGKILDANQSASRYYGYSVEQLRAMVIQNINILPPDAVAQERKQALQAKRSYFIFQHRLADGAIRVVEVYSSPILLQAKPILFSIVHDITERKAQEHKLHHLATTDSLTGLANRHQFLEQMSLELERFKRSYKPSALLMLDLDRFKQVNDHYGHAAGDAVLQRFAMLARQALRKIDQIGRLGGEEFSALLPDTNAEGAQQLAERLRKLVAESPVCTEEGEIRFTISIGVTLFLPADTRIDSILARADRALYRAKEAGRDQVVIG
ncbi:MAG: GGDEF domain-containing protein [Phycisphaerales bacterium]|nr:GGDEF domain-containing protein [Phycisphaerales bacterium]